MYAIFISEMTIETKMSTIFLILRTKIGRKKKVGTKMKISQKCKDENGISANMLYNKHLNGF